MKTAISGISGQLQGLEMALQSLSITDIDTHNKEVIETLRGHDIVLRRCLNVCTSAVEAAPPVTSYMVKHMEAFNYAQQVVVDTLGDAGSKAHSDQPFAAVGFVHGQDSTVQLIAREVTGTAASNLVSSLFPRTAQK
jgi:hypothetical protein